MIPAITKHLLSMEEADTAELLKIIWKDLVKKSDNQYEGTDYYTSKVNYDFELKNRADKYENGFQTYLIEKHKFDKLIQFENPYYICTGGNGIYAFPVHKYVKEIGVNWVEELHSKNTKFGGKDEYVPKECDYWNISYDFVENLTFLLLYPQVMSEKIKRFPLVNMKY